MWTLQTRKLKTYASRAFEINYYLAWPPNNEIGSTYVGKILWWTSKKSHEKRRLVVH